MGRHAYQAGDSAPRQSRVPRWVAVVVVWLAGIAAGMYALLSVGVRFAGTCTAKSTGLACHTGGTVLGAVLLLAVIAVVTTATLITHGADVRRIGIAALGSLAVLVIVVVVTHALLSST